MASRSLDPIAAASKRPNFTARCNRDQGAAALHLAKAGKQCKSTPKWEVTCSLRSKGTCIVRNRKRSKWFCGIKGPQLPINSDTVMYLQHWCRSQPHLGIQVRRLWAHFPMVQHSFFLFCVLYLCFSGEVRETYSLSLAREAIIMKSQLFMPDTRLPQELKGR